MVPKAILICASTNGCIIAMKYRYLNIGCGATWHKDWKNIDLNSYSPNVLSYNITKGIPYPDNYFDAVYHSHLLEHLSQSEGEMFILECARVLKKGGILRVAVPDLETIAKEYLVQLNLALKGDARAQKNYKWITLELYDQATRTVSGGDMEPYLRQEHLTTKSYIRKRLGLVANQYFKKNNTSVTKRGEYPQDNPHKIFRALVKLLFKQSFVQSFDEAFFRNTGELHKMMYDKYSLRTMLTHNGFINVKPVTAFTSEIINFNRYDLDTLRGKVRKADSLFMEARKF